MTGRGEKEWAAGILGQPKGRGGLVSLVLATFARTLAQESDRWFLWLPVVFAGGIVTYFALSNEPNGRVAVTPLLGSPSSPSRAALPWPGSARRWFAHRSSRESCAMLE
jgi:hypothetical protein